MISTAEPDDSAFQGKIRKLQTECQAVHTKMPVGSINLVRMAMRSIILEE